MPTVTINGATCDFEPGQTILQVAQANGIEIPSYCYHDGLSIVASCRICLAECWAPDPRQDGKLAPFAGGKLVPTCQQTCVDGMVVRADSPKSVANQKAVMEYLLINHPLDCPICDQAGECLLQDYSYKYGRSQSRFEEAKVKQPKKDLGTHVVLYADRCIMCSRCVRFTREVSGTAELCTVGRGNRSEIDVFPGVPLDNELSANVIDLCPVGALLDKDFLFAQRVWFLKQTPSIDPLTSSGDNVWIEHNEGRIYRLKPRTNTEINQWWITDEVRYGWKFVHATERLEAPRRRRYGTLVDAEYLRAMEDAELGLRDALAGDGRLGLLVSPMLTCEDAYALAMMARAMDPQAVLALGPVPRSGHDRVYPPGRKEGDDGAFVVRAEKAPNARGVRRVLQAVAGHAFEYNEFLEKIDAGLFGALLLTGGYPASWASESLLTALDRARGGAGLHSAAGANGNGRHPANGLYVILLDTLQSSLAERADVVLPGATWAEKAGTFENATGRLQAFERAIPPQGHARPEAQIAMDLLAEWERAPTETDARRLEVIDEQPGMVPEAVESHAIRGRLYNAANLRQEMAEKHDTLRAFATEVTLPALERASETDMAMVEL